MTANLDLPNLHVPWHTAKDEDAFVAAGFPRPAVKGAIFEVAVGGSNTTAK